MSFLPINEENKEAPLGQTTNAPAPPQTSGSAGAATEAPKGASSGSPTQFGSSASKLGDYLSANAPQITQQAETLAGNLNQQYGDVSQGINNAVNQFGQQVQGGYAASNPDVIAQAMQNPTDFALNPENVQAFQKQYNNAYSGPLSFEGTSPYSDIQNQVGQAVQQGNLLGSEAGLQTYLQGQGTNPSRASSTLDALLLRGNPQAQETIRNAANQLGTLGGQLQTATKGANQSVLDAQKAAADAASYAQGQFNPYVQNFGNQIMEGATQAEKDRAAYNQSVNSFYEQATPIEQQINAWLGQLPVGTPQQGSAYPPGEGPGPLPAVEDIFKNAITKNQLVTNPITAQNYATPEQYAQAQAIQKLTGNAYQLPIGPDSYSQAGTAPKISAADIPTILSLLEEYGPTLYKSGQQGMTNAGNFARLQSVLNAQGSLLNYLNQYDPNYSATRAAPGQFGAGEYWGQGASYQYPGSPKG